jgi:ATP-binding cassette, subfamily B, bacterial PglK
MHTLKQTLDLLTHKEKIRGLLVLIMVIGMALLEAVGVASVMPFLAVLGNPDMIHNTPLLSSLYKGLGFRSVDQFLMALGAGAFGLILLSAAYRTLTHYVMNRFIEMRRHSIETRLMETYLRQPYTFFLHHHSSDMSKTVLSEVDLLVGQILRPAITMLAHTVVLVALLALLLLANPLLAVVVTAAFLLIYSLLYTSIRSYLSRLGQRRIEANTERFRAASEAFGAIKAVKVLGCEQAYLKRFHGPSWRFARTLASNMTLNQIPHYLVEALIFGGILLLTLGLFLYHGGSNSTALGQILPILGLYAFAIYRIKPAAQNIYQGISSLRYGAAAVHKVHQDFQECSHSAARHQEAPAPLRVQEGITLHNISYTYPQAEQPTLQDIQLHIPVGSTVGLVGSTGAGK